MSFKRVIPVLACATLALSACTGRSTKPVQVDQPKPATQPVAGQGTVDVEVPLDGAKLKAAYAGLDLSKLSYKFKYLTVEKAEALTFDANNKATLKIGALPVNTPGTVTLDILEAGVAKLRGTADNVTLSATDPTKNKIALEVKPIDPATGGTPGGSTGGQTTELTIEVSLGSSGGTTPTTPTTPNNPPPQPTDPVAGWDGKSFKGNTKWKICSDENPPQCG